MGVLKIKKDFKTNVTYVCDGISNKILQQWYDISIEQLTMYLQTQLEGITHIMIPINKPYKQMCTKLDPSMKVVVGEEEVRYFIKLVIGYECMAYMEEVAVGSQSEQASFDLPSFLGRFYESHTREEAEFIYNYWQEVLPLNDPVLYKVLRGIESYREEILNYFDMEV